MMARLDTLGRRSRWASPAERFAQRISEVPAPAGFDSPCWQWDAVHPVHGYGSFHDGRGWLAHRWSYEHHVGPVPAGLVLDHLCRNRGCVNPAHLEPVTDRVNVLRGEGPSAVRAVATRCVNGHEFTPENTITRAGGLRGCRTCQRAAQRRCATRNRVLRPGDYACPNLGCSRTFDSPQGRNVHQGRHCQFLEVTQ